MEQFNIRQELRILQYHYMQQIWFFFVGKIVVEIYEQKEFFQVVYTS